jgi:GrpB-like predicted nucleotidyltransferase (UPF0157 family)
MEDDAAIFLGGPEHRPIVIVEYDERWPARYEQERDRIRHALGDVAMRVEHIGSTAVPELAAKPIIDVLVTVADVDDEAAYCAALEEAGYALRVREPGHRMFRTPERDVHVHVWPGGSEEEHRHLTFRDRLRSNAGDRHLYESTKKQLAARKWDTMNDYAAAKSDVIAKILSQPPPSSR